ncbi:MAG: outer membrane beta-barrel protein [Desulfobacteraceae bacterium]|nr:outer membrane beta-barrel protein [Desulfobacteraceae bacterium]
MTVLLVVLFLLQAFAVQARNVFRGGVSLEQEYDSNIYREPEDEVSEWTTTFSPNLSYTRTGRKSTLSLRYSPGIVHSYRTNEQRWDHLASADYNAQLSRNLRVDFRNTFVRTEDPYEDPEDTEDGIELSDRRGRRRYWSNNFSARTGYTYGRERLVEVGYRHHVLENEEAKYSDYVRQTPSVSIAHRINHQWSARLAYSFEYGDFYESAGEPYSDDLTRNQGDAFLYHRITPFTQIYGHLSYEQTDYKEKPEDYAVYTSAAGVTHQYSRTLSLELEAGGSQIERDFFPDEQAVYLSAGLDKSWRRTTWSLAAQSGIDARDFSGVDDLGVSRYWSASTSFTQKLMRDLTGSMNCSYRDDTYLDETANADEQRVEAGAGLAWSFARWYELSARYAYIEQDADVRTDRYEDHRFFVGISAEKDLAVW